MCAFTVRDYFVGSGHYTGLAFFNPVANAYIEMGKAYAITYTLTSASGRTLSFGSLGGGASYNFTCFTAGDII
jgi:hypothetical protein